QAMTASTRQTNPLSTRQTKSYHGASFWGELSTMRAFALVILAVQVALVQSAPAQDAAASRPLAELLPLFAKNHCEDIKTPAEQLFCGDPALNAISPKLSAAIAERLKRLPNRRLAIEENAEWIR